MARILPRLWITTAETVDDAAFLRDNHITHILNCAAEAPTTHAATLTTRQIPLYDGDNDEENTYAQMLFGAKLIDNWIRNANYTIVVHCKTGIQRSVAVVMAWMILYDGQTFETAFEHIQRVRMFIFPNSHFVRILRGLEGWANNGLRDYL